MNNNSLDIIVCPGCGIALDPDPNNSHCWQCPYCEYEADPVMPTVREILNGCEDMDFNDVNLHKFSTSLIRVLVNSSWHKEKEDDSL